MAQFKNTTEAIMKWLTGHADLNTVTFGDASEVDLTTHTDFPLGHVIPLSGTFPDGYTTFSYQVLFLDTHQGSSEEKIEVLDLMGKVAREFVKAIEMGSLYDAGIHVNGTSGVEVIYNARQNLLYGWSVSLNVQVPNDLINCG